MVRPSSSLRVVSQSNHDLSGSFFGRHSVNNAGEHVRIVEGG